jgi:hypothetical protein
MKKFIYMLIVSVLVTSSSLVFASKNNFQFQVSEYHTQRQSGQTLDMFVRYAMKDDVSYSQYPDYRELRKIAASYLEPSSELPANTYWEIVAAKIAENLMSRYPLSGVSVQLLVYPNDNGGISEPGFHGPIYTTGDVIPFNQSAVVSVNTKLKTHD